ncbi:MAG: helix-turn-helix transcriptional regulator [Lachnospiraceae bacterium]|nr:helix-turn-helix transcriptional regulator [Lachnospiraceae bacterium]
MILADKIIVLRKKCGWSQEELAEKMGVTRQSVSKWEGAQSIPDLEKILLMGKLFGVSMDYLLKDEIEIEETVSVEEADNNVRRVSMEEANEFLQIKEKTAGPIAKAVGLCIISPILLILFSTASDTGVWSLSEDVASVFGLAGLFLLIAVAVAIFVSCGIKSEPYEFLENEIFETEYGVNGMVKERRKNFRDTYTKRLVIGISLCVLSVVPLFVFSVNESEFFEVIGLSLLLLLVAIGVSFIVEVCIKWEAMEKLLQEGEYDKNKKANKKKENDSIVAGAISSVYWMLVTAGYLAYSFITFDWARSWIVWPVAGILYAAIMAVVYAFVKVKKGNE